MGADKIGKIMIALAQEMTQFLLQRKRFWLFPIILMLAVFGGLLIAAQGSAIAPFIYTLF